MDVLAKSPPGPRGGASGQMQARCFTHLRRLFNDRWKGLPVAYEAFGFRRELILYRVFTQPSHAPWSADHSVPTDWYYLSLRWDRDDCLGCAPINSASAAKQRFDDVCVRLASYIVAPAELPEDLLDG